MGQNDGTELENLVKSIEQLLLPEGITVISRDKIFDENGVQIAEFDITISGQLGSFPIYYLIECRDRPSAGPAPAAWIEQLSGRKKRFQFDKVVAVSTTGFAKSARDFAASEGIMLRTVISANDIVGDFKVDKFRYIEKEIIRASINLSPENLDNTRKVDFQGNPIFRLVDGKEFENSDQLILEFLNRPILENQPTPFHLVIEGPIDVLFQQSSIRCKQIEAIGLYREKHFEGKMISVNVYSEDNQVIGQEGHYAIPTQEGEIKGKMLIIPLNDGSGKSRVMIDTHVPHSIQLQGFRFTRSE